MLHQGVVLCNKLLQTILNCTKLHSTNQSVEVGLTGEHMKRLLVIAGLLSAGAQAQPSSILYTGQELYTKLSSERLSALAYIAGVADSQSGVTVCIPPGQVTLGQMADMVKQTLERVPSERHMSADIYVQATLEKRWPCARKGGGV
jgi:hypothetical protein